jgi:hypothetical protein
MRRNRRKSMKAVDGRKDLRAKAARRGAETGAVRWVLCIGLGLAVRAGLVVYFGVFSLRRNAPGLERDGRDT